MMGNNGGGPWSGWRLRLDLQQKKNFQLNTENHRIKFFIFQMIFSPKLFKNTCNKGTKTRRNKKIETN